MSASKKAPERPSCYCMKPKLSHGCWAMVGEKRFAQCDRFARPETLTCAAHAGMEPEARKVKILWDAAAKHVKT